MRTEARRNDPLVQALGVASAALGVGPLAATRRIVDGIGVGARPATELAARVVGVRELASAAGMLSDGRPAWLWSRVVGDAMDLSLLGRAWQSRSGRAGRRVAATTAAVAAIAAVDIYAAVTRSVPALGGGRQPVDVRGTTTVGVSPDEARQEWRRYAEAHDLTGYDAEFRDAPGRRGCEIHAQLQPEAPAGKLGETAARIMGEDPRQKLDDELRRFKQVVETGDIVRSDGAPGGKRARSEFPQRPARPMTNEEMEELVR